MIAVLSERSAEVVVMPRTTRSRRRTHRSTAHFLAEPRSARSAADLTVARDDVLGGGHLLKSHRTARVQLLRRDADLGPEAELAPVGEPGRRVHDDCGGVD